MGHLCSSLRIWTEEIEERTEAGDMLKEEARKTR